jgi:Carboxypeptidase regulatory-like domain
MRIRRIFISIPLIVFCFTAVCGARTNSGVSGKVILEGTPPRPKPINMSAEPGCAKMYPTPAMTEEVVVGPGGALENVVVYVSAAAPPESTPPDVPISITQKGCRFAPHVVAMQVNQQFNVINSDSTSHNIHPLPTANREWNKAQPPGTPPLSEMFAREEFIPVKCNIHPWMHSYFAVLKTSHYAVTGESGAFTLNNLPPGKYTITAWHETYGTQTQEITLAGDENAPINFVFKAKP